MLEHRNDIIVCIKLGKSASKMYAVPKNHAKIMSFHLAWMVQMRSTECGKYWTLLVWKCICTMNMLKMCIILCGQARPNSHPGLLCGNTNQVTWSYALKKPKVWPCNCLLLDNNQLTWPCLAVWCKHIYCWTGTPILFMRICFQWHLALHRINIHFEGMKISVHCRCSAKCNGSAEGIQI
jgi:hypothetical protein